MKLHLKMGLNDMKRKEIVTNEDNDRGRISFIYVFKKIKSKIHPKVGERKLDEEPMHYTKAPKEDKNK